MRNILFTSAGFYYSSYFRIKLNTDDSFLVYDNNLSELGAATFLHEYIHFLQDITTTHGLFNIATEVDFIKVFNSKLRTDEVNSIQTPFKTIDSDGNVHANREMHKVWIGSGKNKNFSGDYEVVTESITLSVGTNTWPLVRECLKVGDDFNGGFKYYFGSYCICEGMAYEIENAVYPNVIQKPPILPYSAPRLIANKLYPKFTNNVENLVALCDSSLMYNDPGRVFCYILRHMNQAEYYPTKPEDIYEYVFTEIKFEYQNITQPLELFYFAGHIANLQLSDYFKSNIFENNSIWIARLISASETIRTQIPSFILDLMRGGDIRNNISFEVIKRKLGTPIIVNNHYEMFFENILNGYGYQIEPEYFWVFSEIRDLITKKWSELGRINLCGLKEFCDKSAETIGTGRFTDYRCHNEPWERSNDSDQELCPFGATWKAWGLQGKSLTTEE